MYEHLSAEFLQIIEEQKRRAKEFEDSYREEVKSFSNQELLTKVIDTSFENGDHISHLGVAQMSVLEFELNKRLKETGWL